MSSTTAGTATAVSPTSSYAEGRPRSRGRPSARPHPNLGSAGLGAPGWTAAVRGLGGPGVDGGCRGAWGPWGGRGWAAGSTTAPCSTAHVVLASPHREDRRAGRLGASRSPARVSPHDDLHNRRPLRAGPLGGRAALTPRRIHGREDRRAGRRGGARSSARLRVHDDLHEWMLRWAARHRSRARPRMPQEAGPYGVVHVRGRVCRRRPARTVSFTCAAAYAAVSRPVRHGSRTSLPSNDHVRRPASAGEAAGRRITGRRRAALRTPWPGGGAARRR